MIPASPTAWTKQLAASRISIVKEVDVIGVGDTSAWYDSKQSFLLNRVTTSKVKYIKLSVSVQNQC